MRHRAANTHKFVVPEPQPSICAQSCEAYQQLNETVSFLTFVAVFSLFAHFGVHDQNASQFTARRWAQNASTLANHTVELTHFCTRRALPILPGAAVHYPLTIHTNRRIAVNLKFIVALLHDNADDDDDNGYDCDTLPYTDYRSMVVAICDKYRSATAGDRYQRTPKCDD